METSTNSFKALSSRLYELFEAEAYSESTVKDMEFILRSMSSFVEAKGLKEYTPEIGEHFVDHCSNELHVCSSRISRARNIVGKMNRLLQGLDGRDALVPNMFKKYELPDRLMDPLSEYLAYCAENDNKQTTIKHKYWICGRFLENLYGLSCVSIQDVTGEQVQAAFLALGYTRYWERIGPFFCFLFEYGYLKQNYSRLIQHRHNPKPQPTVYLPEEISAIEKSFDLPTPSGIRNYAIVLLMTRYGIRASDIAALTFDDFDFEYNRLRFVQQKTGDPWEAELFL